MGLKSSNLGFGLLWLLLFGVNLVKCSHWRFGQISWKITSGYTVEFTAQIAWRTGSIGSSTFSFGDGSTISMSSSACSGSSPCSSDTTSTLYYELLSTTTDLSGAGSTLIQYIFYHTYSSATSYTYGFSSCCRVSGMIAGGDETYTYYGVVALANGNTGSPVSSISPVLQFQNGVSTTLDLDPIDNDGDTVTCRQATSTESGITVNSFYTVDSSSCSVTMGETGSVGDKWAAQVIMETSAGDSIPLDFVFEATDPTLEAPECSLISSKNADGYYTVNVGSTLTVEMQGTDADDTSLTVTTVSLPSGASVSPTGSNSAPVTFYLTWAPVDGQQGSFSASVQVSDGDSQSDVCIIPIYVTNQPTLNPTRSPTPKPSVNPTDAPTGIPTDAPTRSPSDVPTDAPSYSPTKTPTRGPSYSPTRAPTESPTKAPTRVPSDSPTRTPSHSPTRVPSEAPSDSPTRVPSDSPSKAPSRVPSDSPTRVPSDAPSDAPSRVPSSVPSAAPSVAPSDAPSRVPSRVPSAAPTNAPSDTPTRVPSRVPSAAPSVAPSDAPSMAPSNAPSDAPSRVPSGAPTRAPTNAPTDVPSNAPTDSPTFNDNFCNRRESYYYNWDYELQTDMSSLSINTISSEKELWIKYHDYEEADSEWLIKYETRYNVFSRYADTSDDNGEIGEFLVDFNIDLSYYENYDSRENHKNPIFAISDDYYYMALKVKFDGTIWMSGEGCNGYDSLPLVSSHGNESFADISDLDDIYFGCQINDESSLYGFENGWSKAITFGMRSDMYYDNTKVFIYYYDESGEYIENEFYFNEIWETKTKEYLTIYVGSGDASYDDYYRFHNIGVAHCTNEWDGPRGVCDAITDTNSSSLNWQGSNKITYVNGELIHGWLDYDGNKALIMDELPEFTQVLIDFTLYVTNFNNDSFVNYSKYATLDAMDVFTMTVVIYDEANNRSESVVSEYLAQQSTCIFNNPEIRSEWQAPEDETDEPVCSLNIRKVISNFTGYAHNITVTMEVEEASKNTGDKLLWGFNQVCLNFTDEVPTTSPTPAPTRDETYHTCENSTVSTNDLVFDYSDNGTYLLVSGITEYAISRSGNSYVKIRLIMNDNYDENSTQVAILLADSVQYSGVKIASDEILFHKECGTRYFEEFETDSDDNIVIPKMDDITWYSHSSNVFRDSSAHFESEIEIEFYFDAESSGFRSYAYVERIDADGAAIESDCAWMDLYKKNSDLNIYVLIENITNSENVIDSIELEYCSENKNMFTTTRVVDGEIIGELEIVFDNDNDDDTNEDEWDEIEEEFTSSNDDGESCIDDSICFDCLQSMEISKDDDGDYTIYFGGYTNVAINSEYNCSCPIGYATSETIYDETEGYGIIELSDGTQWYLYLTSDDSGEVNMVRISFDGQDSSSSSNDSDCDLTYILNTGSLFSNISASNILHFQFTLTSEFYVNSTQKSELNSLWSTYLSNYFEIDSDKIVVTIEMSRVNSSDSDTDTDTDSNTDGENTETQRRRRDLSLSDFWQYTTDIVVYADEASDVYGFNSSDHYDSFVALFCNITGIECDESSQSSFTFAEATQEIVSDESELTYTNNNNEASTLSDSNNNSSSSLDIWLIIFLILLLLCCCWAILWRCMQEKEKKKAQQTTSKLMDYNQEMNQNHEFMDQMNSSIVVEDEDDMQGTNNNKSGELGASPMTTIDEDDAKMDQVNMNDAENVVTPDGYGDGYGDGYSGQRTHKSEPSMPSILVETNAALYTLPDYIDNHHETRPTHMHDLSVNFDE